MSTLNTAWTHFLDANAQSHTENDLSIIRKLNLKDSEFSDECSLYIVRNGRTNQKTRLGREIQRQLGDEILQAQNEQVVRDFYLFAMKHGYLASHERINFAFITNPRLVRDTYATFARSYEIQTCQTGRFAVYCGRPLSQTEWYGSHFGFLSSFLLVAVWPCEDRPMRAVVWCTKAGVPIISRRYTLSTVLHKAFSDITNDIYQENTDKTRDMLSVVVSDVSSIPYVDYYSEIFFCDYIPYLNIVTLHRDAHIPVIEILRENKIEYDYVFEPFLYRCKTCGCFHRRRRRHCYRSRDDSITPESVVELASRLFPYDVPPETQCEILRSHLESCGFVFTGYNNLQLLTLVHTRQQKGDEQQ